MNDVLKSYANVNPNDRAATLGISRMESIYDRRKGQQDEPHRHQFYTVLVVKEAKGEHIIDFNIYSLNAQQVYFISPGQVHQVIEEQRSLGYSLVFSNDFLAMNNIPLDFVENLSLFNDYGETPPLLPDTYTFDKITGFCEEMLKLAHQPAPLTDQAIGAYLKLLLITCNQSCDAPPSTDEANTSGNHIVKSFKTLVNEHYRDKHASSDYADMLHISSDHLNRIIKSAIGKNAKEYIQSRITTAARRLLYFTDLSTKEIAYELGFSEPANFSAFFKKCTGVSPSRFREQQK